MAKTHVPVELLAAAVMVAGNMANDRSPKYAIDRANKDELGHIQNNFTAYLDAVVAVLSDKFGEEEKF